MCVLNKKVIFIFLTVSVVVVLSECFSVHEKSYVIAVGWYKNYYC